MHAGQGGDVVELLDHALDHQPVLDVAGGEVDHREVAERADALAREALVEREAVEGAVLARAGDADDRVVADEGDAAGEALQEADRLEAAGGEIDVAELAGARLHQPEPAAVETRRVRHGEAGCDNRAIQFTRGRPQRVQLYRELIKLTRATLAHLRGAAAALAGNPAAEFWQAKVSHYRPLVEQIIAQTERRVLAAGAA